MTSATAIIVLNWNGRSHLEPCLAALAVQTCRAREVIVVDNGSTDDSVAWLRDQTSLPVRLVALDENRGFAGGNAAGLAVVAQGIEFVVLLNNDTAPEPGWLEALVKAAEADGRRGAIASLLVDWTGSVIDSAGIGLRVTGRGYQRQRRMPRSAAMPSGPVFGACAGAALYRRTMLDEVGFLDERFFMNGEDTDLSFRARLAGWEVWYCAEAVVRHRVSASQGAGSASSVYFNERNWIWSVIKCMPAGLWWKYSWLQMFELPARGGFFLLQGRFGPWLRGILVGVAGAWEFRSDRRRIQGRRRIRARDLDRMLVYPAQLGGRDNAS